MSEKGHPELCHAKALIFLEEPDLITINRIATIAKKEGYYASLSQASPIEYIGLKRILMES